MLRSAVTTAARQVINDQTLGAREREVINTAAAQPPVIPARGEEGGVTIRDPVTVG